MGSNKGNTRYLIDERNVCVNEVAIWQNEEFNDEI